MQDRNGNGSKSSNNSNNSNNNNLPTNVNPLSKLEAQDIKGKFDFVATFNNCVEFEKKHGMGKFGK